MTTKNKDILYTPGSQAPTNGDPLSYAQWLYGKSVYDAEQMRLQADKQAETDRQRAIVDANSAYQQGRATYGANAEAMAGMGLSSSGYGEYLTGKAYATQRGEVQNANVTAQARKDKALYEENSVKTQAAQIYANDLIGIKNQQTADYGALYDAATQGTSIEVLMQDGRWASLTADQQSAIRQITSVNSLKAQLDGGASLDEIVADANSGWGTLTVDAQQQLTNYYNTITDAKQAEHDKAYTEMLDLITQGASIDDFVNTAAYTKLNDTSKANLHYKNMLNQINAGAKYEDMENSSYWQLLGEDQRTKIKKAADDYTAYEEKAVTAEVSAAIGNTDIFTKDQLIEDLMLDYKDTSFINKVVEGWQKKNFEAMKNDKDLTQAMIDQAVAKGRITPEQAEQFEKAPNDAPASAPTVDGEKKERKPITDQSVIKALNAKGPAKFGDIRTHNGKTYFYNNGWRDVTGTPWENIRRDGTDIEDPSAFIESNKKLGTATTKGGAWHMNNLRQGFEGEDVELIIGSSDGAKGHSFDAKIGAKVSDEAAVKALNKLATGSETGTPSVDYERALNIFGANNTDSNNKPGKIVAYNGVLYIYTRRLGWARLEGETAAVTAAMTAEFIKNAS